VWDGTIKLGGGAPLAATVVDIAAGATCTFTEPDNGGATTVTVDPSTPIPVDANQNATVTMTNTFDFASLAVTKKVDSAAVDQDGKPIPYGPFTVTVTCTYQGQPDFAEGYDADHPMTADLSDGQTGPDTGAHPPNTATITNTFGVGSINVIKKVTGDGASRYGSGPFTVAMTCVLKDASGTRTVWDGTIKLGGGAPLHKTVNNIAAGATCTFTEPDNGGATTVTIDPSTPIPVDANQTATVTVIQVTLTENELGAEPAPAPPPARSQSR
jgi:hypothetical protein